jgi:hypothetical protein
MTTGDGMRCWNRWGFAHRHVRDGYLRHDGTAAITARRTMGAKIAEELRSLAVHFAPLSFAANAVALSKSHGADNRPSLLTTTRKQPLSE